MAMNTTRIDASPAEIYAVLADARSYEQWVVGCDDIRAVEGDWPAPGSVFHHTVGTGPFKVKDNTKVLEVEPDRRLVIEARARPAGVAKVSFELRAIDGATEVRMEELPVRGVAKAIHNPFQDRLIHTRNTESLRRLADLVRRRRSGNGKAQAGAGGAEAAERERATED